MQFIFWFGDKRENRGFFHVTYMARTRRHRHKRRGGSRGGSPYTSASSYGAYVNGSTNAQYSRVFDQNGPYGNVPGNAAIGAQGQSTISALPTTSEIKLSQTAGGYRSRSRSQSRAISRSRDRSRGRSRSGGMFAEVLQQAAVPLSLLGMQKVYGKRTRRHR